ncbi:hypothetical protein N7517_005233, partial [Penicillium concentricum]
GFELRSLTILGLAGDNIYNHVQRSFRGEIEREHLDLARHNRTSVSAPDALSLAANSSAIAYPII